MPNRQAASDDRLACTAPATNPVDVPELLTQRRGVCSLAMLFTSHRAHPCILNQAGTILLQRA
jgi:hypothetical protein